MIANLEISQSGMIKFTFNNLRICFLKKINKMEKFVAHLIKACYFLKITSIQKKSTF